MTVYDIRPFMLAAVHNYPLASRKSKVSLREFAKPPATNSSLAKFLDSLPRILAAEDLRQLLGAIHIARKNREARATHSNRLRRSRRTISLQRHHRSQTREFQRPCRGIQTAHPGDDPLGHRHGYPAHAPYRRRRRSRRRHASRFPPLLCACAADASRRRLSQLGLRCPATRNFSQSRFRRPQSRRPAPAHYHCELRLYPALSSVAECSEAPDRFAPQPARSGIARLRHHRPPRAALAAGRRRAGLRLAQETPRWNTMSLFDDNPLKPPEPDLGLQPLESDAPASSFPEPLSPPLGGDPISYAAAAPPFKLTSFLPEDLSISWSWPHL